MKAVPVAGVFLLLGAYSAAPQESGSSSVAPQAAVPATSSNPLLVDWTGPSACVPPFDRLRADLFPEELEFAIAEQQRKIAAIADNRDPPTFANTIEALERAGVRFNRTSALFRVMVNNVATPEYQRLQRDWAPRLAAASDEMYLNSALFQRVAAIYEGRQNQNLDARQLRLVSRTHEQFVRRGADLTPEAKLRLSTYNQELARLFTTFNQKVLADEQSFVVARVSELGGIPEEIRNSAGAAARDRRLPAGQYAIINTRSVVEPVLSFADDRALRERVWRGLCRSWRQRWCKRYQRDDPRDRARSRGQSAPPRLPESCALANPGHDGRRSLSPISRS